VAKDIAGLGAKATISGFVGEDEEVAFWSNPEECASK
jgi:bifunctional ADP-heptose synthase (sugar kinase/adenylyltransferase)